MRDERQIHLLNRLLELVYRSLPMYLVDTSPWTRFGNEAVAHAVEHITHDQQAAAQRIAELIDDRGGLVDLGEFPLEFTSTHDTSLDYMLGELQEHQRAAIGEMEMIVEQLGADRIARELAEETLGAERAHLEMLEALDKSPQMA